MMENDGTFGFDEFDKAILDLIKVEFPHEIERKIMEMAYELLADIQLLTPIDTTNLKRSFTVGDLKIVNGEYVIEVGTNVEYAPMVEEGHKTVNGGFVAGHHMVEISLKKLESNLPNELQTWLQSLMREFKL